MKPIARELLRFIFLYPTTEFAYRELERKTSLAIGTVSRYVKELKKQELVKTRRSANAILVSGSAENPLFIQLKRAYNLEAVYSAGLVSHLLEKLRPDALILFGSYSRGEDYEDSDIDIATINGREANFSVQRYERKLARKISLTPIKDIKKAPRDFRNTLANGIVLAGSIEVV